MSVPDLVLKELLNNNCLIVDGISRSGKALVAPLVTNLSHVDFAQYSTTLDHIPILWKLGLLNDNAASSFLRMSADIAMYERGIGRHLNTRPTDTYSVFNSLEADRLLGRSQQGEGKIIADQFNKEGRYFSFVTHEMTPLLDLWFLALPAVRAIIIERHPIDICHSWLLRGWGERWGTDPMAFIPAAQTNGEPFPWFAYEFKDDYAQMSPPNRIIKCVLTLFDMYETTLNSLPKSKRQQTYNVFFEKILTEPVIQLQNISDWLGCELHPNNPKALENANIPAEISVSKRISKLEELRNCIDPNLFESLCVASSKYEMRLNL